jgi:hydroxyacylglutathione hydrolase
MLLLDAGLQSERNRADNSRMASAPSRSILLETFAVGMLQCNCTILGDRRTGDAVVVDPGDEIKGILTRLTTLGLELKQILITHAHIDHVGGALKLKQATGAPILLHPADIPLLNMMDVQAGWLGIAPPAVALPDGGLEDGAKVGLPTLPGQVLYTPGHTEGSVCLYFEEEQLLIAGDTLFAGSIGRTDLPFGDAKKILRSIRDRLMTLPERTRVIPGHGAATTIGAEVDSNPFLLRL